MYTQIFLFLFMCLLENTTLRKCEGENGKKDGYEYIHLIGSLLSSRKGGKLFSGGKTTVSVRGIGEFGWMAPLCFTFNTETSPSRKVPDFNHLFSCKLKTDLPSK